MFSNDISHTLGYVVYLIPHIMLTWTLHVNLILPQLNPSSNPKTLNCAFGTPTAGNIISLIPNILTRTEVQGQKHTDRHKENQKVTRCPNDRLVIFLLPRFPCYFIHGYSRASVSQTLTLQGALGSDRQWCGKWLNELLIWWLWYGGDWRHPNLSGYNLQSCGLLFLCYPIFLSPISLPSFPCLCHSSSITKFVGLLLCRFTVLLFS